MTGTPSVTEQELPAGHGMVEPISAMMHEHGPLALGYVQIVGSFMHVYAADDVHTVKVPEPQGITAPSTLASFASVLEDEEEHPAPATTVASIRNRNRSTFMVATSRIEPPCQVVIGDDALSVPVSST